MCKQKDSFIYLQSKHSSSQDGCVWRELATDSSSAPRTYAVAHKCLEFQLQLAQHPPGAQTHADTAHAQT